MRLIDADAFAKFITMTIERNHYDTLLMGRYMTVKDVLEAVIDELNGNSIDGFENAPTIDAVPVVRCKECKHGLYSECYGNVVCCVHHWTRGPKYYCGDGLRREDDDA